MDSSMVLGIGGASSGKHNQIEPMEQMVGSGAGAARALAV